MKYIGKVLIDFQLLSAWKAMIEYVLLCRFTLVSFFELTLSRQVCEYMAADLYPKARNDGMLREEVV